MTRGEELWIKRTLYAISALMLISSAGVFIFSMPGSTAIETGLTQPLEAKTLASNAGVQPSLSPALEHLQQTRFSKTIVTAKVEKPAGPPIQSLIRLKGVMDFGNPKSSEALIENIGTGVVKTYKVGDTLDGIQATVEKIDTAVMIRYEGASVKLEMQNNDRTSIGPLVTPNSNGGDAPAYTAIK